MQDMTKGFLQASRLKRLGALLSLFVAVAIAALGLGQSSDESLRSLRDGIRAHPATGQVHIVEIDAASIAQFKSWPWPRSVHAALVDRLHGAGVTTVAFDVDFSASTNPQEDAALAAALERFGGSVVLTTFRQTSGSGRVDYLENLPIALLRSHAFLASVNVHPDEDGQMRDYSFGTVTNNMPRPSMAALLAGSAGRMNNSFRIDQSIDPPSIPRHSVRDVISGKVGKAELAGKTILIGATAIELGDRYVVPRHGVLPGVVIQALATETLIQGTENPNWGPWPLLVIACIAAMWLVRAAPGIGRGIKAFASLLAILSLPLLMEMLSWGSLESVPALALISLIWAGLGSLEIVGRMHKARFADGESGLPNESALLRNMRDSVSPTIIAIRIGNYTELSAILSADQSSILTRRIVDRIKMTYGVEGVYHLQLGLFALALQAQAPAAIIEQMEASAAIFRSPINLDTRQIVVSVASGMAEGGLGSPSQICANARLAADEAAAHGHSWSVHNALRLGEADRALQLLSDLDEALASEQIHVVFQPKWDIAKSKICGAEALVRWQHPTLGAIAPDHFIPLLEAQGRTGELTMHVLALSVAQLRHWDQLGLNLGVAVNLSATLLGDHMFMSRLRAAITDIGPLVRHLTLEITESATLSDQQAALTAGQMLKNLGICLSIDDYGTGQSTLTYLKTFSASEIKIDKSFVTNMLTSRSDQILVRSTIELAHELGFEVVAEGIEDGDCLAKLAEFGCDIGQGWHLGRPVAAEAFLALVAPAETELWHAAA